MIMSMKNLSSVYLPYLLAMSAGPSLSHSSTTSIDDIDFSPKKQPPPKGTRLYKFDGFETVAISEKSATKKYQKWLLSNSKTLK
jgi:hypothetical protein